MHMMTVFAKHLNMTVQRKQFILCVCVCVITESTSQLQINALLLFSW